MKTIPPSTLMTEPPFFHPRLLLTLTMTFLFSLRNVSSNLSFQGTLRDEAAQRP